MHISLRTMICCTLFFVQAAVIPAWSQATTGSISGVVTDPAGARVAHAAIAVRAQETGITTRVESDAKGVYRAASLVPGHYVLTVRQTGFRTFTTSPFELEIDQSLRIDASLAVGEVTDTMAVSGVDPLLVTQGGANGQVIGAGQIADLPLLGRDFIGLMLLVPGVSSGDAGNNVNLAVNGQREFANSIQLNGVEITGNRNNDTSLRPGVDAMQEFKVVTSGYAPEFGRASGGAILLETKAGSSRFHASAWEYFRPTQTAAAGYKFSSSDVSTASQLRQHNFGVSAGGPLRRDRTFFFASYEGTQLRNAYIYDTTVPTLNQVTFLGDGSADLSALTDPFTGNTIPIFDPYFFQSNYYPQKYAGNVIPAAHISSGGRAILTRMFPQPNNSNVFFNNFTAVQRVRSHGSSGSARFDQVLTARDRITLTFDMTQSEISTGDPYQGSGTLTNAGGGDSGDRTWLENESMVLSWVRTFSSRLLHELRASYLVTPLVERSLLDGTRLADKLGIANANLDGFPDTWGFPQIQFETGATTGGSTWKPLTFRDRNLQIADAVTWMPGHHAFKFGYEYRRLNSHPDFSLFPVPYEYIGGSYAALTSDPTYCSYTYEPCSNAYGFYDPSAYYGTGGSEIADLLLGLPYVVDQGLQLTRPHTTSNEHTFYLQDSWQLSPLVNLTYGARYEYRQPYVDANDNAANFDLDTLAMQIAGRGSNSRSLVDSNTRDFAPRVGLAVRIAPRTTVRLGYGLYFTPENDAREDILTKNYPFFAQDEYVNGPYSFVYMLDAGIARPTTVNLPAGASSIDLTQVSGAANQTVYYEPQSFPTGYSEMTNLTVQHLLPHGISIEAGYVGTQAHKLSYSVGNYNLGHRVSSALGKIQTLLPAGQSNYNALQAKLERRYAGGWSTLAAYTYAHSLDNGPAPFDLRSTNAPQSPFHLAAEYASSDFDLAHNVTLSNQLDLPFGRGRRYLRLAGPALEAVAGGWRLSSIAALHTGTPVNVVTNSGFADYPGLRPNLVTGQDPTLPRSRRTLARYFNTAAFAAVTGQSNANPIAGSAGRNLLRGPGYTNEDLALLKQFAFRDRLRLQLRAEAFNLLNTPHYGNPNANFSSGSFGSITSAGQARVLQFALRLDY